ncbi:hypothetical protein [Photobacterium leiognathi]|uniref:hypothetical protein n=1 Tax=Photobacterium leiognathi TaxID=553611 RepID=UPI002738397E|nr:hypothetical protein [Photobacterium leiognathi]
MKSLLFPILLLSFNTFAQENNQDLRYTDCDLCPTPACGPHCWYNFTDDEIRESYDKMIASGLTRSCDKKTDAKPSEENQ